MQRPSLDSERPIMAPSVVSSKRASNRYSTYSNSPSFSSSYTTTSSGGMCDPHRAAGMQEIKNLTQGLDRLENKPLTQQRFVPTAQKSENMSKLALGAKVERALGRRLTNQDAVYRGGRTKEEKHSNMSVALSGLGVVNEKMGVSSVKA